MSHKISLESGTSVRLLTSGKYCERDIVVTATGGTEDLNDVLSEQESLIDELKTVLQGKAAGGGGGDSGLPSGYSRCDFIRFTGAQSIDTGIICNQTTKIQTYFTRESSGERYLYGVVSNDNSKSVTAYLGGRWRFGKKYSNKTTSTIGEDVGYGVCVDATQITVSNNVTAISDLEDFEAIGTLLIGACRSSNGAVGEPQFIGKIFFFSIYNGGEQVLHLVPVTDGAVYRFWDTVSEAFFDSITDTPLLGGNL